MAKGKNRSVFKRSDGIWVNKLDEASRASSAHTTQRGAIDEARRMMKKPGQGGELVVHGVDGKIRSKDTINRSDPLPPRDKEH